MFWCNTALVNGLLGANTNSPTVAASSFRPETRLNSFLANDATVSLIYSYGELPLGVTPAQNIKAVITNQGSSPITNLPVTLNVTGVDSFTDMQTIPSLSACGGQATVTFMGFTPGALGSDTVTVTVPADDFNGNNSRSRPLNITALDYSYKYPGSVATGGVGVDRRDGRPR